MQLTFTQDITMLDRGEWEECYRSYLSVYDTVPPTDIKVDRTWDLVRLGRERTIQAREVDTGKLMGVAHFFPMLNLRRGKDICYLDVLVVHPDGRRCGVGSGLLEELRRVAKEENWEVVRWLTGRESNDGPRKMYFNFGTSSLDCFQMDAK